MLPEDILAKYGTLNYGGGSSNQTIVTNTWTKILLDYSKIDEGSIVDKTNNRIHMDSNGDSEGLYSITGTVRMTVHNGYRYEIALYKNGTILSPYSSSLVGADGTLNLQVHKQEYLEADDYIELYVRHNYTSAETVTANTNTEISVVKQLSKITKPFNR